MYIDPHGAHVLVSRTLCSGRFSRREKAEEKKDYKCPPGIVYPMLVSTLELSMRSLNDRIVVVPVSHYVAISDSTE